MSSAQATAAASPPAAGKWLGSPGRPRSLLCSNSPEKGCTSYSASMVKTSSGVRCGSSSACALPAQVAEPATTSAATAAGIQRVQVRDMGAPRRRLLRRYAAHAPYARCLLRSRCPHPVERPRQSVSSAAERFTARTSHHTLAVRKGIPTRTKMAHQGQSVTWINKDVAVMPISSRTAQRLLVPAALGPVALDPAGLVPVGLVPVGLVPAALDPVRLVPVALVPRAAGPAGTADRSAARS